MKRVVIVHCWGGNPDYVWYPQAKRDLEAAGYTVLVPLMPETDSPKLALWLPKLQEVASPPEDNLFLIGHSTGCTTILRYLESLPEGTQIGGVVLVGGFPKSIGYAELENFFETPLDFEKIKPKAKHFVVIHSDNDPYVPVEYSEQLRDGLGAEFILKPGMGHFAGKAEGEIDCVSLPDVTEAIKRIDRWYGETR